MRRYFGTRPRDLKAAIGPGIQAAVTKWARKSETSLTLSSPMRPSCSVWSKRSIPCVKNIPCYFSPHAPRAIAICQRKYSSTWWKRIVNNC